MVVNKPFQNWWPRVEDQVMGEKIKHGKKGKEPIERRRGPFMSVAQEPVSVFLAGKYLLMNTSIQYKQGCLKGNSPLFPRI